MNHHMPVSPILPTDTAVESGHVVPGLAGGEAKADLGDAGAKLGAATGAKVGAEVARRLGRALGAEAGLAAGRMAGARAAVTSAREEACKLDALTVTEEAIIQMKATVVQVAQVVGKEAEFVAGSFILTQRALDEAPYRYSSFLTQVVVK